MPYLFTKKKNLNKKVYIAIIFMLLMTFQSCLRVNTHLKSIEPHARPLSSEKYELIGTAECQSSSFRLLWFFPVTPKPKIYESINKVIAENGGNNLIDVYLWHERQYWIVGTVDILRVQGKVIRYSD